MSLLIKARRNGSEIVKVTPQSAGWKYVGFAAYRIPRQHELTIHLPASDEACIVVLSGMVSIRAGQAVWREIGERKSVFDERSPYALYLPRGEDVAFNAHTDVEIGVASAPGGGSLPARLL